MPTAAVTTATSTRSAVPAKSDRKSFSEKGRRRCVAPIRGGLYRRGSLRHLPRYIWRRIDGRAEPICPRRRKVALSQRGVSRVIINVRALPQSALISSRIFSVFFPEVSTPPNIWKPSSFIPQNSTICFLIMHLSLRFAPVMV